MVFALLTIIVFSAIADCSGMLGDRLRKNPHFANTLRLLTSAVLIGLGVHLALSGRQ
jgi:threonine/homoserine/homoserine lactone efflux protein